jgi:hypothetical protein
LKAGCHQDAVRNLIKGKSKNWRGDIGEKIMSVIATNRTAILGGIGANDEVDLIPGFDKIIKKTPGEIQLIECETFLVPSELSNRVVHAWRVRKGWEGPLLREGDVLWTTEIRYKNFDAYLNEEVLVHLSDGRTFIKRLEKGSAPGKYSLMGVSVHGFMRDVDIVWCALIAAHIKKLSL